MKIKQGIVVQKIDEEYILIDSGIVEPTFSGMVKLNESSKAIVDLLMSKDLEEEEIVEELSKIYDASREELTEAVHSFLKELKKVPVFEK